MPKINLKFLLISSVLILLTWTTLFGDSLEYKLKSELLKILLSDKALSPIQQAYAQTTGSGIPSGMVMFFNLTSCPAGWSAFTTAQGRYIVGLPSGGTLGQTTGQALTNQENRSTGYHTHSLSDPGHTHQMGKPLNGGGLWGGGGNSISWSDTLNVTSSTTGISIGGPVATGYSVAVSGTNAPYVQLLTCVKI